MDVREKKKPYEHAPPPIEGCLEFALGESTKNHLLKGCVLFKNNSLHWHFIMFCLDYDMWRHYAGYAV